MSHLQLTLLMAAIIAAASGATRKVPARERAYAAVYVFLCAIASTFALGWLMHVIHQ